MLDAREARRLDLNSEELGVPVEGLMRSAGRALAAEVAKAAPRGAAVVIFCGKGHNGGDGLAAAAELAKAGRKVSVVLAEEPTAASSLTQRFLPEIAKRHVTVWDGRPVAAWENAEVLVDCLLGSGLRGVPRRPYSDIIRYLNKRGGHGATVIACDVPSGLGSKQAVRPQVTVTFHARKAGMTNANSGRIVVADIGIPDEAKDIGIGDLGQGYVVPEWDSHKGDNGILLVVAGSIPLVGAPHYVATAAYRTGVDLVHVATAQDVAAVLRTYGPETIVHGVTPGGALDRTGVAPIATLLSKCRAVVIGPGLGRGKETLGAVREILLLAARRKVPMVVDADGLDALTPAFLKANGRRMVLTPHAREFQDLSGKKADLANVVEYAKRHGGVTVLRKGSVDVVTDGKRTRECHRGHPTLTVGGTGDLMAGITGALLAKGARPFEAACAASYLAKCAGEVAASYLSYGATAKDVADAIPSVLLRLE